MARCAVVVVLLALCGSSVCEDGLRGYVMRTIQSGLDYVNKQAVDMLDAEVQKFTIPDQSGKESHFHYTISNIRITRFTKPSSSLAMVPKGGLSWSANNAGISIHCDWRAKWHKISTSGSIDVFVSGVSLSVAVAVGTSSTGKPTVKSESCQVGVGNVNVNIHGKVKKIIKMFHGGKQLENTIRSYLLGKLCTTVNGQINKNAEIQLAKLKVYLAETHIVTIAIAVLSVVAVIATLVVMWILSCLFPRPLAWLVGGGLVSVGLWFLKMKLQSEMPDVVDFLLALVFWTD